MQRGAAKGLKVPCLFMIAEVSIRCQKKPGGWYTPYTRVYPPIHHCGCPSCRPTNSVKAPENKTENTTKKQATMSDKTTLTSISIGFYISHLAKCDRNIDTHTHNHLTAHCLGLPLPR